MKHIKTLAIIAFLVGIILIFGAVGTDDFYVMELHQDHVLNWWQVVTGALLCVPLPLINEWWG